MADSLEQELRRALAAQDPGDLFTQRVLAGLPEQRAAPKRRTTLAWLSMAAAASIVAATLLHQQYLERREGERAKAQLLQALRLTSDKLDLAYRAVDQEDRS